MPDWRKAEDYAYTSQLTLHDWAWEFLRRNDAFRVAWKRYKAAPSLKRAFAEATLPFGLWRPCDPAHTALEAAVNWRSAVEVGPLLACDYSESGDGPWPGYPTRLALGFDFTQPVEPQIEHAASILRSYERHLTEEDLLPRMLRISKPKGRARPDRYPLYIRVLDAKRDGASVYRIGRDLGMRWDNAKRTIKAAEAMASEGYRELLLRSPSHTPK